MNDFMTMITTIRRLQSRQQRPLLVALDGGSGAGKSTVAAVIGREVDVVVIPLDDFFAADIPDASWDTFSVEDRLQAVFAWQRLREHVLEPLLARTPATWYAFDFASGQRPDGTYGMQKTPITRTPADVIVLEGAYSAGPALADLIDLSILVDVPVAERHARIAVREDHDFLETWHRRWDPVEQYYFTHVRPRSSFDVIVTQEA